MKFKAGDRVKLKPELHDKYPNYPGILVVEFSRHHDGLIVKRSINYNNIAHCLRDLDDHFIKVKVFEKETIETRLP